MNFIDRLEGKLRRYAIPNLIMYLVILQVVGFVIILVRPEFYWTWLSLDPRMILRGQIWRLVTFVCYPPSTGFLWAALACYVYYSLGRALESILGVFRFNLYIFIGILGDILAAFIIYAVWHQVLALTANELYMSMLLAFAATFPEAQFRLYFVIPIKAKWLGIVYGALTLYSLVVSSWPGRVAIIMSLLNFIIFFFFIRKPVQMAQRAARKVQFKAETARAQMGPRHRCAVCGITELDAPNMEFRYCSKCDGQYEYCMDHLYTHVHVKKEEDS